MATFCSVESLSLLNYRQTHTHTHTRIYTHKCISEKSTGKKKRIPKMICHICFLIDKIDLTGPELLQLYLLITVPILRVREKLARDKRISVCERKCPL